jgi:hypothetical protein
MVAYHCEILARSLDGSNVQLAAASGWRISDKITLPRTGWRQLLQYSSIRDNCLAVSPPLCRRRQFPI